MLKNFLFYCLILYINLKAGVNTNQNYSLVDTVEYLIPLNESEIKELDLNSTQTLIADISIVKNVTKKIHLNPHIISNRSLPDSFITTTNAMEKFKKVSDLALGKKYFNQNLPRLIKQELNNNNNNNKIQNVLIERNNNAKIYIVDFDFYINEFTSFEPKNGYVELDAKFIYKWWDKRNSQDLNNDEEIPNNFKRISFQTDSKDFFPSTFFKDKAVDFKIKNQIHTVDNLIILIEEKSNEESKENSEESLLSKFEKFKANNKPLYSSLIKPENTNNEIFIGEDFLNRTDYKNKKRVKRQYSCIEQNVTLKFKCKQQNDHLIFNENYMPLDTSRFPFDSHVCDLDFDLIPTLLGSNNKLFTKDDNIEPIYLFSVKDFNNRKHRIELDELLFEYTHYNKLVQNTNSYSWISKEWILKKLEIFYKNSSSPYLIQDQEQETSNDKVDELLLTRKDKLVNNYPFSFSNNNLNSIKYEKKRDLTINKSITSSANINLRFSIYRRREPQIYIFILPLILFTLITFIIFFMPTTNTSEKTLIAFLNFVCLLTYNIYIFKLVIYTYEFLQLPMLLQYSNSLMIIQLGVLAYTCLVKSVYHYGFLTLNKFNPNLLENSFKEILSMSAVHLNNDLYSFNPNAKQLQSQEETEPIFYHGCEKVGPQQELLLNTENQNNENNKCLILSRSNESIKLNMPIIKLNESDTEAMNAITTTIMNDENNYVTYNQIESVPGTIKKCSCNIDETDADCCNNSNDHMTHHLINGCVNSGAGTISHNPPSISKIVTVANDLLTATDNHSIDHPKSEFLISSNKGFNSNWIFSKCCNGSYTPDIGKISPSPLCEHVRPIDLKRSKKKNEHIYCVSTATTQQLMPEYDYTSHLTRLKEPIKYEKNSNIKRESFRSETLTKRDNLNNLNNLNCEHKTLSFRLKPNNITNSFGTNIRKNNNENSINNTAQLNIINNIISNQTFELSKLNLNMQKMVKFEELFIKEKILKDEWKRKARLCDGICCLLVFFLLALCSMFIFIILPNVKTASLMD